MESIPILESNPQQHDSPNPKLLQASVYQNKQWQADRTIADIVASIESGSCLEGLVESDKQETNETLYEWYRMRKFRYVFWGGTGLYANLHNAKGALYYNGLVYVHFAKLSSERLDSLFAALRDDPYTHILYTTFLKSRELHWVVRVSAKRFRYKSAVYCVVDYLKLTYGITWEEIAADSFVEGRLCCLTHSPSILYQPSSIALVIPVRRKIKQIGELPSIPSAVANLPENTANNLPVIIVEDSLKEASFLANEQETIGALAALERLDIWFLKYFVKEVRTIGNPEETKFADDPEIRITIKGQGEIDDPIRVTITGFSEKGNEPTVTFEIDPASGAIVVCEQQKSIGKQTKPTQKIANEKVCQYLLDVLAEGELLVNDVYKRIAPKVDRSVRTVRAEVAKIFADESILKTSTGKSLRLAKRSAGSNKYLYLIPLNGQHGDEVAVA